jgi:heme A synthase
MSARRFAVFSWGVLAYALVVISWGYFLRISQSGDGCGTSWPLCEGAFVPAEASFPTWVELIHRVSSGLVLAAVVGMAAWAVKLHGRGHPVRLAAALSLVFTVSESLFGALLVVFGWVAEDVSTARVLIRPFHVTNNFFLMASLGLTAWWSSRGLDRLPALIRLRERDLFQPTLAVVVLAATGSWTGLAGTAFPAESLREGLSQYLSPAHVLVYLRTVHPLVALVTVALVARLLSKRWAHTHGPDRRVLWAVAGFGSAQILLGPLVIALLHPVGLRMLHLLVADLFWLSFVFFVSSVLEEERRAAPSSRTGVAAGPVQP